MSFDLRPYQRQAIDLAYQRVAEGHRPIICAPTGSGKTVIAGHIAKEMADGGKRVLWMTGREEIVRQTHSTFDQICACEWRSERSSDSGVDIGVLMGALKPWWFYPRVTVASWDTLKARWDKSDLWKIPADVVLIDECHLSLSARMSETILPYYQDKMVVGLTATPARRTGKGLGSYFTRIVQVRSVQQLIDEKFLAPCEYWAGSHVDTTALHVDRTTNDYQERELGEAALDGKLIGDVLDNWLRIAKERHTIIFAVNIAHAQGLAERFKAAEIAAEVIHSKMGHESRVAITRQFREQKIQVLVNVGIATYGFDCPSISCVVLARPTKSIVLHHQMIGRGIRPKPDGGYCMVLDHADNVRRLGCIEDEIRWRLSDGKEAAVNTTREGDATRDRAPQAPPTECESCHHVFSHSRQCPKCGWEKPVASQDIQVVEADLVKIRKAQNELKLEGDDRRAWYLMARGWCILNGKKTGMAYYRYKDKFGEAPKNSWVGDEPPDTRVSAYMRAGLIRFAKSRGRLTPRTRSEIDEMYPR